MAVGSSVSAFAFAASCVSNQFILFGKRYAAKRINPLATTSHRRALYANLPNPRSVERRLR
jgi:hypothetical protein